MLSGMRHPQIGPGYRSLLGYGTNGSNAPSNATRGLGQRRLVLALVALAMLIVTFMPMPIEDSGILSGYVTNHWHSRR